MSTPFYEMTAHEYKTLWYAASKEIEMLTEQLTAAQAREAKLREVLVGLTKKPCQCFAGCEKCANEPNWYDAAKALAQTEINHD